MNLQQQLKKRAPVWVFENPANMTKMYSEHSEEKSRETDCK